MRKRQTKAANILKSASERCDVQITPNAEAFLKCSPTQHPHDMPQISTAAETSIWFKPALSWHIPGARACKAMAVELVARLLLCADRSLGSVSSASALLPGLDDVE